MYPQRAQEELVSLLVSARNLSADIEMAKREGFNKAQAHFHTDAKGANEIVEAMVALLEAIAKNRNKR